ncbi:MAG TPA: hypothetical protein VHV78_06540, partial [Gemmatimonadaceae bacterium]|nr:hypothetical protein [Gemmatimonadaceae bacterium]
MQARALERGDWVKYKPIYNRFGFTKGRLGSNESEDVRAWTVGVNPILFPYLLGFGPGATGIRNSYQLGVPVDDTNTWHMQYFYYEFPPEVEVPAQDCVPYAEVPLKDADGKYLTDYVLGQDMVAWYEQGAITDRTQEHLGQSDSCVIAYRKLLAEQIDIVREGGEPMNVFRDPSENYRLERQIPGSEEVAPPIGEGQTA